MKKTITVEIDEMSEMLDCIMEARIRYQYETRENLQKFGRDNILTKYAWKRYKQALEAEKLAKHLLYPTLYH